MLPVWVILSFVVRIGDDGGFLASSFTGCRTRAGVRFELFGVSVGTAGGGALVVEHPARQKSRIAITDLGPISLTSRVTTGLTPDVIVWGECSVYGFISARPGFKGQIEDPVPTAVLKMSSSPPCPATMALTMLRPSPVPPSFLEVVKNGS